jgi:hypothetical protein
MASFERFDNEVMLALQALGFGISSDNNHAHIRRGGDLDDVTVCIMQLQGREDFCVHVTLPNASNLMCFTTRQAILNAVQRAARDENEAAKLAISEPHGIG